MSFAKTISFYLDYLTDGICPIDMFQCGSKFCIPIALRCNFKRDCADGSDENGCGKLFVFFLSISPQV